MITVDEAARLVLLNTRNWGNESIPLSEAKGRVITEALMADRPMPPFDRVTMDGIAIHWPSFDKGQKIFPVAGIAQAGSPQQVLEDMSSCLEVMTGAVLPKGVDTVIRYEDVQIDDDKASIQISSLTQGQNIHRMGSDRAASDHLLVPPRIVSSAEVNVAATVGKSELQVARLPNTVVISTGDELVPIEAIPQPHQIRRSNLFMVRTALQSYGINADLEHLVDDETEIKDKLKGILKKYDLIILSGGVSAGKFDFIPKILTELGVVCHFHKVAQRPGKPIWFGSIHDGPVVFGLPGNPVSSLVGYCRYIQFWLDRSFGLKREQRYCRLKEDIHFKKQLTYFAQVKLVHEHSEITAIPVLGKGSGDLANLLDADGFVELPLGKDIFNSGETYPFYPYRI